MNVISYFGQNLAAAASVLDIPMLGAYGYALLTNVRPILRSKSLAPADMCFMKKRSLLEAKSIGGKILLNQPDFGLVRELYGRNIYFPEARFVPPAGSKVIDLGANVGLVSVLCAKLGADVLAVEAQSGFLKCAWDNFVLNGMENRIELVHAVVGAATGVFSREENRKTADHWGYDPPEIAMGYLVEKFVENQRKMIHLLKIDIEGSEFDLFGKQIEWLDKVLHISMEVHPEFGDVRVLRDRITNYGFRCYLVPSWRESGVPKRYPGFLFASRR